MTAGRTDPPRRERACIRRLRAATPLFFLAIPAFPLLAAQLFPSAFFNAAWPEWYLPFCCWGRMPVSCCPRPLWGSASGAGRIAEDGGPVCCGISSADCIRRRSLC